jgi:hypothetical protein
MRGVCREIEDCTQTVVLLTSLDQLCVAETVRRQVARPFGRSPEREEAVIRARFEIYQALPTRKVETMRPTAVIQLKRQAKELLRRQPLLGGLRDAQRVIAQQYGFDSWDALRAHVESAPAPPADQSSRTN